MKTIILLKQREGKSSEYQVIVKEINTGSENLAGNKEENKINPFDFICFIIDFTNISLLREISHTVLGLFHIHSAFDAGHPN